MLSLSNGNQKFSYLVALALLLVAIDIGYAFTVRPSSSLQHVSLVRRHVGSNLFDSRGRSDDEEEEGDEEEDDPEPEIDPYERRAKSEFVDAPSKDMSLRFQDGTSPPKTNLDWGGAMGKLRQRVEDVETGQAGDPSRALFRLMSSQSPNQAIGNFVNSASPQIVQAMSSAVGSLLGGLSSPTSGIETVVKATGDKVASLCFQLQMTGYLFRNAEYVMALKDLMKLRGGATLQDYKDAFERVDSDGSGYIEANEVEDLFSEVNDGKPPEKFEIDAFVKFFDENKDGRISWEEFQRGLFGMAENVQFARQNSLLNSFILPGGEDDEEILDSIEPHVTGELEIQMEDGKTVTVDAEEYVSALKAEAKALKDALKREKGGDSGTIADALIPGVSSSADNQLGSIASYIASRQGDVKALTEGISPDIVKTMHMLVDFVLEGGESAKGVDVPKEEMEMVIPGTALQQLALWQLVLGYRLREAEAKGEYKKLLE